MTKTRTQVPASTFAHQRDFQPAKRDCKDCHGSGEVGDPFNPSNCPCVITSTQQRADFTAAHFSAAVCVQLGQAAAQGFFPHSFRRNADAQVWGVFDTLTNKEIYRSKSFDDAKWYADFVTNP